MLTVELMLNPEKHGYEFCSHCNGYGSSLSDPIGVDRCTKCGGTGLQRKKEKDVREQTLPGTRCVTSKK